MSLLDRRLLIVSGKGGVGKTTVAAAIGLVAARSGRRTLVIEVASQRRLQRLFGDGSAPPGGHGEVALYPNLAGLSIDPQHALEEYLLLQLRVRALVERLAENRVFGTIAAAAPGLRELVTLGKVWQLSQQQTKDGEARYQLMIVDAPATGHGIGFLRAPRTFLEIARIGRVHAEAREVADLIDDRMRTGILLVTLPEEMPVNETIEALGRLNEIGLEAAAVVVNGLYPRLFTPAEHDVLWGLEPAGETAKAALRAALSEAVRQREQAAELRRLARAARLPRVELPLLFRPEVDLDGLLELADVAGPALEALP